MQERKDSITGYGRLGGATIGMGVGYQIGTEMAKVVL